MIDLHTHILPGLDDGAQSLADAVAMARAAAADGITTVLATPHANGHQPLTQEEVARRARALQGELEEQGIALRVLPGIENAIAPDLPQRVEGGTAFPLAGTPYLLVELPLEGFPPYTEQVLFELQVRGLTPLLAHPERNAALQRDPSPLERLVRRGILAQVTAASLMGAFGPRTQRAAVAFLKQGLVHVIATDAHAVASPRAPLLSPAVAVAARIVGQAQAWEMVEAIPHAILEGQPVAMALPERAARKTWAFWRR